MGADLLKLRSSAWATTRDYVPKHSEPKSSKGGRSGALVFESSGASSSAVSSEDEEGVIFSHASSSFMSRHSPSLSPSSATTLLSSRVERKHSSLSGKPYTSSQKPFLTIPSYSTTSTQIGSSGNSNSSSAGGSGDRSSPSSTLSVYAVNRIRAESEAEKEEPKDVAFALDSDNSQHHLYLNQRLKATRESNATRTSLSSSGGTSDSLSHLRPPQPQQHSSSLSDAMFGVSLPLSPVTPPPPPAYSSPSSTGRRTPVPSPLRKGTMCSSSFSSSSSSLTATTTAVALPDPSVLESALLAGIPMTATASSATTTTMTTADNDGVLPWTVGLSLLTQLCPIFHTANEKDVFMQTGKALWLRMIAEGGGEGGDTLFARKVDEFAKELLKVLVKN